jgi:hypothetical protein
MHTLHDVAVKLDSEFDGSNADELREDTVAEVHSTLIGDERPYGSWYDWFVVGGGRFVEGDAYSNSDHAVVLYGENPTLFLEKMNEGLGWQLSNAQYLFEQVSEKFDLNSAMAKFERGYNNTSEPVDYASMGAWTMRRLMSHFEGYWNPDSHFLDITNGTPTPQYLLNDIEQNPAEAHLWALVPVDFHY